MSLFNFPKQIELLKRLFNSSMVDLVTPKLERLNEIFFVGEEAWKRNLGRLRKVAVQYVIFSEAAPWTKTGPVRHFYHTFDGDLSRKVWRAFFDYPRPEDTELSLRRLADRGLLLIDSLPFAMKYTTKIRKSPIYGELIKGSAPLLVGKINDPRIRWARNVKGAFAYRLNGKMILETFPEGIRLPTNQLLLLNDNKIAADQSGYTNSERIREILEIKDP
jgi:hypothetical protein